MNSLHLVFLTPFSVLGNSDQALSLVFDISLEKLSIDKFKNEPECNEIFLKGSGDCHIYSNRHQDSKTAISKVSIKS